MRSFCSDFVRLLRARDNLIYALTYEENDVIENICEAIMKIKNDPLNKINIPSRVFVYSRTGGLAEVDILHPNRYDPSKIDNKINTFSKLFDFIKDLQNYDNTLNFLGKTDDNLANKISESIGIREEKRNSLKDFSPAIFIVKDLHLYFNDKDIIRTIRDLKEVPIDKNYCPIIVTSPILELPAELEKIFTLVEVPLMNKDEILKIVSSACSVTSDEKKLFEPEKTEAINKRILAVADACSGLTSREIIRAILHSKASHDDKAVRPEDIHKEKIQIIKKSGALDFIIPQHSLEDLGGCENFKDWIKKVKAAMSPEAEKFGIPKPKGAMLVGVPGTSKTVSAEILASYLNVPLIGLDMAKVMGSFVGQSERQIANALKIAKGVAPCVLLIDESEKILGGIQSSNGSDAGTLNRVMSQLLNFLQQENTGVITIMTSNDVSQLPPELTRTGRLDAQWVFDLPNPLERREIINIYVKKNNLEISPDILDVFVEMTENFTGAEIKSVTKDILVNMFYRQNGGEINKVVTISDIKTAVNSTVTIWKSSKEKIEAFRAFSRDRYLNASKSFEKTKNNKTNENNPNPFGFVFNPK